MKLEPECIPCMLNQALREAKQVTDGQEKLEKVLRAALETLRGEKWTGPPTLLAQKVHATVRKVLGVHDPYAKVKKASNSIALKFYPRAKELVVQAKDRLEMAIRLSIAGNVLDYAALQSPELFKAVESVLGAKFAIDDYDLLRRDVLRARRLTFFSDNAGEIVLDRLLIETMEELRGKPFEEIIFVVRGGPIVNDATEEDARQAGILELKNVGLVKLSNGEPGTGLPRRPEAVRPILSEFNIMKGQGNYEAFNSLENVYFLMMVKCPAVSHNLGVEIGRPVIYYNRRSI